MRHREKNIVIFGETGSGKSFFINTIAQRQLTRTSNDAHGCTSTPERYPVEISGRKYVLIDTPGLNELPKGTVPDAKAKELLKNLLHELMSSRSDEIGLLVYCIPSAAHPRTFIKAYNKFYSGICQNKVPIILVVKGCGNERDMENWWNINGNQLECRKHGMHFKNYPCDPARQEVDCQHILDDSITELGDFLRNLIDQHYLDVAVDASRSEHGSGVWCASSHGHRAR
ncbi:P-loop containing nucleoside triphosphate hydrolase protein [Suillus subluteus]|nr:P-loop containing nucleoside triphosphate hydrolase protein [Suillus subluteus]